jgi:hypothetical protein
MGMFDHIRFEGHEYQTKDTPNQLLDYYEIKNSFLYEEQYESRWIDDENALFKGYLEKFNENWVKNETFTGEIRFYRHLDKEYKIWEEFSAYFVKGKMEKLIKFENDEITVLM